MRHILVVCLLSMSAPAVWPSTAFAQADYQPTPPPTQNASGRSWYQEKAPIAFAGDLYYPAGPQTFFDGNVMMPTGTYDGITLYADASIEPYSVVFVPIGRGLMRPYERRRAGDLAGTTGSSMPSFPVEPGNAGAAVSARSRSWVPGEQGTGESATSGSEGQVEEPFEERAVRSARQATTTRGIWVSWRGYEWRSAGDAVHLADSGLAVVGSYEGFPVFARSGKDPHIIYLPSLGDLVAPYQRVRQAP